MSPTRTSQVGAASVALVRERAQRLVAQGPHPAIVLLRARPHWTGESVLTIDDDVVHIATGLSQLDVLDQIVRLPSTDSLIVLTDQSESELGDTVLMRVHRQRIEHLDAWDSAARMFDARSVDPGLRQRGTWIPAALLGFRPPAGWPRVTTGVLTADHALGTLLARILNEQPSASVDEDFLLNVLDREPARQAWRAAEPAVRDGLTTWARAVLGPVAGMALTAAAQPSAVSPIAIGLALDALWPAAGGVATESQIEARGRVDQRLGGSRPSADEARSYAEASHRILHRADAEARTAQMPLRRQAEALLAELGWPAGAEKSGVLPAGFRSRLRSVAASLDGPVDAREKALAQLARHDLAAPGDEEVARADMAVRLARWLEVTHREPTRLTEAIGSYAHDGGWADRAYESVCVGSADANVAAAYRNLLERVRAVRHAQDEKTARLLADATAGDGPSSDGGRVVPVESLLADVVTPLADNAPVLLVVLDGMSVRVAAELSESIRGWTEMLPGESTHRVAAISALPTVTTYSRTSLFSGRLTTGKQSDEKRAFAGTLFHKSDLRAPAGSRLPDDVTAAIRDSRQRTVGVVLNTIDDALASHDPGGTHWVAGQVQHLGALLDAARDSGRAVILTSDHGHIVEHACAFREADGAEARWRSEASGPPEDGEVLLSGRRVLANEGRVVLPWRDDIRYASIRAGYHGGASSAELTVPVLVLVGDGQPVPGGWHPAVPQAPPWWNEPAATGQRRDAPVAPQRAVKPAAPGQDTLIDLEPTQPARDTDVVDDLLGSEMYQIQRSKAGRMALPDEQVAALLRAALGRGGHIHQDNLATAIGVPTTVLASRLAALRRVLNLEGYPTLEDDADGVSVRVNENLLREQFEL